MTDTEKRVDLWHTGAELDDAAYMLESSARLVLIMHTAFIDGQSEPGKDDFEAIYPVFCQIDDLAKKIREIGIQLQTIRTSAADRDGAADVLQTLNEAFMAGREGRPPRHVPAISCADEATREKMKIYGEAMIAMYQRGRRHAELNSTS